MLEQCKVCQNKEFSFETGIKCKLTGEKPDYEVDCTNFLRDDTLVQRELNDQQRLKRNSKGWGAIKEEFSILKSNIISESKNVKHKKWLLIVGLNSFFNLLFYLLVSSVPFAFLFGVSVAPIMPQNVLSFGYPAPFDLREVISQSILILALWAIYFERGRTYRVVLLIITIIYFNDTLLLLVNELYQWDLVLSGYYGFWSFLLLYFEKSYLNFASLVCHIVVLRYFVLMLLNERKYFKYKLDF